MAVHVITDSTSYIPRPLRAALDIGVVGLTSELEGVTYADNAEDFSDFYRALRAPGVFPTTSQPSVQSMVELLEERAAEGDAVVGVFISQLMSGTYSTALLARDMVLDRHPNAAIEIVDSQSNCMELGLAALAAARAAQAGESVDAAVAAARDMIGRTRFLFTPMTLEYLRRGGRIGAASALLGALLQVKPVLTVVGGRTDTHAKVRSLGKAWDTVVDAFAADVRDKGGLDEVYVHHIDDPEAGRAFADRIAEVAGREVEAIAIGPAIGTHVGPGTVGVVYATKQPMRKHGSAEVVER
jgi:DegV family protein with EDD domain